MDCKLESEKKTWSIKGDISLENSVKVQDIETSGKKIKTKNPHHRLLCKNRRSQSIIPTQQPELDTFMKSRPCPSDTVCWKDTLSPKKDGDEKGSEAGSLPRTLSTSVLRIKHRRTFWERCAR